MKNIRLKYFLAFFFLLASAFHLEAGQSDVRIRSQVDKRSIFIGDRIHLSISVSSGSRLEVEFPMFQNNNMGPFEVRDSGQKTEKKFLTGRLYSQWYDITSFTVGKFSVPVLEVKYRTPPEKEWQALKTEEIHVTVESVIQDKEKVEDIKDIKGPFSFFSLNNPVVWSLAASLVLLVLTILIFIKIRRRVIVRPPHVVAFEELERIKSLFATTGDIREYYFMISDCVRTYIENALGIKAPEMTTEEFLVSLHVSRSLSEGEKGLLMEFLKTCDMVKFAKHVPTNADAESVFNTAKNFIAQTRDEIAKREVEKKDVRI
ncbi:MAG: hypothetical protein WCT15_02605 [Candidatus Omnitrophota bacterium]